MRAFDISDYEYFNTHDVQPVDAQGATITPVQDAMGAWATVWGTPLVGDYHAIEIVINSITQGDTFLTDSLTNLGWDPAGGTNYGATAQSLIPYLYSGYACGQGNFVTGVRIFLPVLIPSGSTIGAQGQIHSATVGTQKVFCKLYKARRPRDAMFGTQVLSFGENLAVSQGTAMTFGASGALGSWTQVGSALVKPTPFWWTVAAARAIASFNAAQLRVDIGFGSSTSDARHCVTDWSFTGTTEARGARQWGGVGHPADGDKLFVRGSAGGGATDYTALVHGVI